MDSPEMQSGIVEQHLKNDHPLLRKYTNGRLSSGGSGPDFFSASSELCGLPNIDNNSYLPHFEFNVGSAYHIEVSREVMSGETIYHKSDGILMHLKSRDGDGLIEVCFPTVSGLFDLRNLSRQGSLLTIPQVRDEDRERLPIDKSQVHAGFYFRASSTSYGQLVARMEIDHREEEEVIMAYLETIDRRFADYSQLQQHFTERDDKGNRLWEDQNQQSRGYNRKRGRLHNALFGELADILKKADLELNR